MEKLVFVFDKHDFLDFNQNSNLGKDTLVICKDQKILEKCTKMKINCKMINEYELSDFQILKPLEWIKTWPDKILQEGKNFKELFVYNNISIFWYLENRLYHKRIHELITTIEYIKKILLVEKPNKIFIIGNREFHHIISQLHENVEVIENKNNNLKSNIAENSYSKNLVWKLFLLKISRGFGSKHKFNKKNPILFLTEVSSWRKTYNHDTKKYENQDVFFHKIIKKLLEKDQLVEVIDFENNPKRLFNSFSINKKRVKSFGTTVMPWEKFLTFQTILKSKNSYNKMKKKWNNLRKSEEFKKSLNYEGISIYELVKYDFDELFNSFKALAAIAMIETAKRIVEIKTPSKIIMHDEYGALQLSFLYASKKLNIPSLSLQHGTIHQNIFAYTHNEDDINNEKNELNFPLPDKMCVWSENVKNALISSAKFPSTIPIVTGDPKMEIFLELKKKNNREKTLEKFKISHKKKIILFATENLPNLEERNLIANAIFKSMLNLPNLFLVIKMHPNEKNFLMYQKIAEKKNISSYIILQDVNLYQLIHACDIVIVSYSTVGLEAMRMSKPVIALNLMGIHNESIIIKNSIAQVIKMETQLAPSIIECLKNQDIEKMEDLKVFAENELGKINPNSTEIILENILNLKSSKREGFKE